MVVVPALFFIFSWLHFPSNNIMHMAAGTSLAIIIFTSISAMLSHYRLANIRWSIAKKLLPGIIVGIPAGVMLTRLLPSSDLKILFALFVFIVGLRVLFQSRRVIHKPFPKMPQLSIIGLLIGTISSMLGIGAGSMAVPYLHRHQVPMHHAAGTTTIFNLTIAVISTIGILISSWQTTALPQYSTGFIYWPAVLGIAIGSSLFAPLGAHLASHISPNKLKRLFGIFLLLTSLNMLYN